MSRILAIDLGKFKSVTCLLDTATNQTEFWTMTTDRQYLLAVLKKYAPELVVIESCSLAGWVHDECTAEGYQVLVCNPNQEAWKWKHVKRKTDRDDALKLAKLAALRPTVPVYIPGRQQREYRRLVKYRQVVLGRINRVQNNIRSIFVQRGLELMRGQKAWGWKDTTRSLNIANRWPNVPWTSCGAGSWIWSLSSWTSCDNTSRRSTSGSKCWRATSACSCSRRFLAWAQDGGSCGGLPG